MTNFFRQRLAVLVALPLVGIASVQYFPSFAQALNGVSLSWNQQVNTPVADNIEDIAVDSTGSVYGVGYTLGSLGGPNLGGEDAFIVKYSPTGVQKSLVQFGSPSNDDYEGITIDKDGNIIIAGFTEGSLLGGTNAGQKDTVVTKFNKSGVLLWSQQLGSSAAENWEDVTTDSLGNILVAGHTRGSLGATNAGSDDVILAKYNSSGTLIWFVQFGTPQSDIAKDVSVDGSGNVYVTGHTAGSLAATNQGGYDRFTAKYSSKGKLIWKTQTGGSGDDFTEGIVVDKIRNVFYTTGYYDVIGQTDSYLEKANSADGTVISFQPIATPFSDTGKAVALDASGGVYVTGQTQGSLGSPNIGGSDSFLEFYTSSGTLQWIQQYGSANNDVSKGVALDSVGNIFTGGYTLSLTTGDYSGQVYKFIPNP